MENSNTIICGHPKFLANENRYEIDSKHFKFRVFSNVEEIKSLKDFWKSKQWQHYTDFDYYINIVVKEKGILRPYIISIYENGNPIFLLIGNILKKDFKLKLGYKSLLKIKAHSLEIMYGGILGDQSPAICKETIYILRKILAKEKIDYVFFKQLDISSNIYKAIKSYGGKLTTSRLDVPNPHIYMDLPDSFEKFLETKSSKRRHEIKRRTKKFEEDLKGRLEFKLYRNLEDLDTIMKDTEEIASQTYQSKLGVIMNYDSDTRTKLQYELQNGRLMVFILYIDGRPIAYSTNLVYKNTFLGSKTGYLQEYYKYRPGSYLMSKTFSYLCDNTIVNKIDFGFGYAEWKRDYSTSVKIESNVSIYSLTPKGFILNWMGIFNRTTLLLYRKLAIRFQKIRRIKKKSRDKLINDN